MANEGGVVPSNITSVKAVHLVNAQKSICRTDAGIVRVVKRCVSIKASWPIICTASPIVIDVTASQMFLKQYSPIVVIFMPTVPEITL